MGKVSDKNKSLLGKNKLAHSKLEKRKGCDNDTKPQKNDIGTRRGKAVEDARKRLVRANKRIADKIRDVKKSNLSSKARSKKEDGSNRPATFILLIFISDRRRRDVDNMVSTICDCLVNAGVVDDDNVQEIGSENTKVVFVPKGQEGFEIMIIED